ncbi:cytochrome c oxidase subunit II [Ornithinibacillus halophilus]|uniref:Cytochrome aa3 subunit 2 n=1 Tax=Ornithinibacillus halophilus TaxID=930117 RepID=A0A1M5I1H9_9BACI|nr:cytochrome c oxidase subunit II [Ornithinibacillus halophilus]SHG22012.1 cytochrome c oxidase subunit 2 [Ornithinibacillus halophilus]
MHRHEKIWLTLSSLMIIGFLVLAGYQAFALELGPPSHKETIDPQKVDETAPFNEPGVYQTGENEYEVVMIGQVFSFNAGGDELVFPAGSTVTFTMTSKDVVHGFQIAGTNVNTMVMPGYVQKVTQTFDSPGEYLILCNEYCGSGHQLMASTITIE